MKTSATWAIAVALGAAVAVHGSCFAGENSSVAASGVLGALAGSAVPAAELNQQHARGVHERDVPVALLDVEDR